MYFFGFNQANNYQTGIVSPSFQECFTPISIMNGYNCQNYYSLPTFINIQPSIPDYHFIPSSQDLNVLSLNQLPHSEIEVNEVRESKRRERNTQKQIQSAKKNSQSNLVNHFFSYFSCREKSQKKVEECIKSANIRDVDEKTKHLFYNIIHVMNSRRGRKYVNRKILLSFFTPEELERTISEIKEKIQKLSDISLQQMCLILRKCCFSFFRTCSVNSILTSKRITCVAKQQHFKKRRKVVNAFHQKQQRQRAIYLN